MTSTTLIKKWIPVGLILIVCMIFVTSDAYAQVPSRAERIALRQAAKTAGFSQIFFSKQTFERVMQGADRVRFANGVTDDDSRNAVLMAIGLDSGGNEIGDQFIQANIENIPAPINRATRDRQFAAAEASTRITAFVSEFDAATLRQALDAPGATGITFAPRTFIGSDGSQILSLTVVAATSASNTMRMGPIPAQPCPPDCGDQ